MLTLAQAPGELILGADLDGLEAPPNSLVPKVLKRVTPLS
jgi:hypothetical protein